MGLGSFLSKHLGGAMASPIEAIGNVLDKLTTNDEERAQVQAILGRLALQPHLAQAEINKLEAQNRNWWVAGWRPGIGWVCAAALAMYYLPQFGVASFVWVKACLVVLEGWTGKGVLTLPPYPIPDIAGLTELVMGMLGLAGMRTIEKLTGKAK